MCKKSFSLLLVLLISVNILFTSLVFLFDFLKTKSINYTTTSVAMINFSKSNNISKSFIDVCSNISNMLVDCNSNDKTKSFINKKETGCNTFPIIFTDQYIGSSAWKYKYDLCNFKLSTISASIKKHIVDKQGRTSDMFMLLLLQILIYLIVLNMSYCFNNFYLIVNKITPSLRTV